MNSLLKLPWQIFQQYNLQRFGEQSPATGSRQKSPLFMGFSCFNGNFGVMPGIILHFG